MVCRNPIAAVAVAVPRHPSQGFWLLVGYVWPAETDDKMELSDEARNWIAAVKALASHADKDGIVCIPPVGSEPSASDRLLNLLADAYGSAWSSDVLAQLLAAG
jgi:hypothetical protein